MTAAGLCFDTSQAGDPWNQGPGPHWRSTMRGAGGYAIRFSPACSGEPAVRKKDPAA
jgi:hypothetical protein